jgi:hypothetical protein
LIPILAVSIQLAGSILSPKLAGAVSNRPGSILGSLSISILAVSILLAGSILGPKLAAFSILNGISRLTILLSADALLLALSDAVSFAGGRAVTILCCYRRTCQKASNYQSRQYSYILHVFKPPIWDDS